MPSHTEEEIEKRRKERARNKEEKKRRNRNGDIFSLFGLGKVLRKRNRRFAEETGIDFRTGKDLKKKDN